MLVESVESVESVGLTRWRCAAESERRSFWTEKSK